MAQSVAVAVGKVGNQLVNKLAKKVEDFYEKIIDKVVVSMEVAIIKKNEEGIDKKIKEYKKIAVLEEDEINNVVREVP